MQPGSGGSSSPGGYSVRRRDDLVGCREAPSVPGAVGRAQGERPLVCLGTPVLGAGVAGPMVKIVGWAGQSQRAGCGQASGACRWPSVSGVRADADRSASGGEKGGQARCGPGWSGSLSWYSASRRVDWSSATRRRERRVRSGRPAGPTGASPGCVRGGVPVGRDRWWRSSGGPGGPGGLGVAGRAERVQLAGCGLMS